MQIDLQGKRALVTGSTQGIGYAIAEGLANAGAAIILNGRSEAKLKAAIEKLSNQFPNADISGVAADLSTTAGAENLASQAGEVDILVNNTGIFEPKEFFSIPDADWTRMFEVNVMSGVRMSRALMPAMLKKNWGRIIFISSESGLNIPKEMIHYGFSKTAQLAVSRGLAELTAGTGVTVNAVLPGPTRSDGVEDFLAAMAKQEGTSVDAMAAGFVKQHRPTSLIERFATTEEVANMVVYACSTQASATNGAALRVEGGLVRYIA